MRGSGQRQRQILMLLGCRSNGVGLGSSLGYSLQSVQTIVLRLAGLTPMCMVSKQDWSADIHLQHGGDGGNKNSQIIKNYNSPKKSIKSLILLYISIYHFCVIFASLLIYKNVFISEYKKYIFFSM